MRRDELMERLSEMVRVHEIDLQYGGKSVERTREWLKKDLTTLRNAIKTLGKHHGTSCG